MICVYFSFFIKSRRLWDVNALYTENHICLIILKYRWAYSSCLVSTHDHTTYVHKWIGFNQKQKSLIKKKKELQVKVYITTFMKPPFLAQVQNIICKKPSPNQNCQVHSILQNTHDQNLTHLDANRKNVPTNSV